MTIDLRSKVENSFNKNYKKFILVPLVILILSIIIIAIHFAKTGDFINRDISLKGGLSITINTNKDINPISLETQILSKFSNSDAVVRKLSDFGTGQTTGINIEVSGVEEQDIKPFLEEFFSIKLTNENYSIEDIGASLGATFFKDLIKALVLAFIFMSIVVFAIYRKIIPSLTVILTALIDIIATIAVLDLFGIKLSTGSIAALLLLIGYSIDSDMLLTTKMIRNKTQTPVISAMYNAMKTGLTMTIAALGAFILGFIFTNSLVIKQILLITIIGLLIDVVATYLGNGPILLWYVKKNENKQNT
ncbi:MAG TPA: hypothetical protein VJH20_01535 [Candidatus Nanoarchaeia archaeon]|nr:hypothetical protein [Candidatus Nanoarchaeia archaeon]